MVIVCYGDSNTWGYDPRDVFGEPYNCYWPDILGKISGFSVRNEGVNGRKIPDYPYAPPSDTDLLAVMLGTNDLLQGKKPEEVCHKMEEFMASIPISRDRILLIAPPPMKLGQWVPSQELIEESVRLADGYRQLSARLCIHFANAGQWNIPLTFDGVHFTEEGHRLFAHNLYQYLINCAR